MYRLPFISIVANSFLLKLLRRSCATVLRLSCVLVTSAAFAQQSISFTQAQVDAGRALYKESCQVCHGSTLANGQFGTPLRGDFFRDKWKGKSLGELVAWVYEKMPPDKPKTLTSEQYLSAVAFILSRNDIAASGTTLSGDSAALAGTKLPW